MEDFEGVKTTSWLDILTRCELEDIDESEKRYLFHNSIQKAKIFLELL